MFENYFWLILILAATFLRGVNSIVNLIVSQENLNSKRIYFYGSLIAFSISLLTIDSNIFSNKLIIMYGAINGILFYLDFKILNIALKNLSPSIIFINIRLFSTIGLFFVGLIFFKEYLDLKQILGILLGMLVFIFLFDKKDKPKKNSNIKKGYIFLGIMIINFIIVNSIHKLAIIESLNINVYNYMAFIFFFMFLCFFLEILFKKNYSIFKFKFKKEFYLSLIFGISICVINLFYFKVLGLQNLVIIYKIFSFEIVLPIIFSMIFYKEKVTLKKSIAFILTIISIIFLV